MWNARRQNADCLSLEVNCSFRDETIGVQVSIEILTDAPKHDVIGDLHSALSAA